MSSKRSETRPRPTTLAENAARAYRAALNRLIQGRATHPSHAGRAVRITRQPSHARRDGAGIHFTQRIVTSAMKSRRRPTDKQSLPISERRSPNWKRKSPHCVRRYTDMKARSVCWRLKTWLCCTAPAQPKKKLRHMRSPHIQSVRCSFVSMSVPEMLGAILHRQKSH